MGKPIAIVCGEGGVRGGYVAGVLAALQEHVLDLRDVDTLTAVSASVGSVLHLCTYGSVPLARHVWVDALACPRFICGTALDAVRNRTQGLNLHRMIEIFGEQGLYDEYKSGRTHHHLHIPLLNVDRNEVEVWGNDRIFSHDLDDVVYASKAAPVLVDDCVTMKGARYMDAGERMPFVLPPDVKKFRTLVVLPYGPFNVSEARAYKGCGVMAVRQQQQGLRALPREVYQDVSDKPEVYNAAFAMLQNHVRDGSMMLACPVGRGEFDYGDVRGSLTRSFDAGVAYVENNRDALEAFLG